MNSMMSPARTVLLLLLAGLFQAGGAGPGLAQSGVCARLESQLAQLGNMGVSSERLARYEQAIGQRRQALGQAISEGRRAGCGASGFLFFQPVRPPVCDGIDARIRKTENELHRLMAERQRVMAGRSAADDRTRNQILVALGENGCGAQYARYAMRQPNDASQFLRDPFQADPFGRMSVGGTYRTICVRTCDGYYWPISFATASDRFGQDANACEASCPGREVELYTYRNPGEGVEDAVSTSGAPYSALPNAFRYRKDYVEDCACRKPLRTAAIDVEGAIEYVRASGEVEEQGSAEGFADVPLPRPRPGTELAELVAAGPEEPAADKTVETIIRPDGRTVRVIGPGFTFYQRDDG